EPLAGGRVLDRGELLAVAELHRPLEPHAAELARRPGDGEQRRLEAAARHRLRAEAIALAEDDGEERHGQIRADDEQAAHVANQRRLLDLGPDHHPRRVAEEEERQVEGVAELHESRGLVRSYVYVGVVEVVRIMYDVVE